MLTAQLLSGLGLAGSAGLNAWIPLLTVSLLARFGVVTLHAPFDLLAHPAVTVALGVLLLLEMTVDKLPAADHLNDVLQTFIRPAAGALAFAGASGAISDVPAPLLVIAGLVTAFGVHATKAAARPIINTATLGVGAPVVSVAEDLVAVMGSLLAVFAPLLSVLLFAAVGLAAFQVLRVVRRTLSPRVVD